MQPLLIDAHEDLAWNALTFGRDYTRSAHETRRREAQTGSLAPQVNGDTLLGWPEYQAGRVAVVFATLFAAPRRRQMGPWDTQVYGDLMEAYQRYQDQLHFYHQLTRKHRRKFRLITTREDLQEVLDHWQNPRRKTHPVGLVMLMEGAEGVRSTWELDFWWEDGLRIIGLAWAGTRFCGGTGEIGPLTPEGRTMLRAMGRYPFILDISHMDEQAALQALEGYPGPIIASHANVQALVQAENNRHLSDDVIRLLIQRDSVIGIIPYNRFLDARWRPSQPRLPLEAVVEQIDHICQLAGNARHVGLGSDFDGGFGVQHVPEGIDTIADLQRLGPLLAQRGYRDADIAAILGGNWARVLENGLPSREDPHPRDRARDQRPAFLLPTQLDESQAPQIVIKPRDAS